MSKAKQIKAKLVQVKEILTAMPESRDNDRELIAAYWRREYPVLFQFRNADGVLRALVNKELSMPDDITRARRKVQELCPELRGARWAQKRRRVAEAEVRQEIKGGKPIQIYAHCDQMECVKPNTNCTECEHYLP